MSEEKLSIYGYEIRIPLEQLTLDRMRFAADTTRKVLESEGVVPGPFHQRCEPSRWVELDGERFFMPAEVLLFREGFKW